MRTTGSSWKTIRAQIISCSSFSLKNLHWITVAIVVCARNIFQMRLFGEFVSNHNYSRASAENKYGITITVVSSLLYKNALIIARVVSQRSTGHMANSSLSLSGRSLSLSQRRWNSGLVFFCCDNESLSFDSFALGRRHGGPRNSVWECDEGGWTDSECTSSCEVSEHNDACRALEVIGQDWSIEVVSLPS